MGEIRHVKPPTFDELKEKYPKKFNEQGIINKTVDTYAKKRKQINAKLKSKKLKQQKNSLKTIQPKTTVKKPVQIPAFMNTWYADGFHNQNGCGYLVCDANKEIQAEIINLPDYWTVNECEYHAVMTALTLIPDKALLCSDSELIVRQIRGEYACNHEHLILLRDKCRELMKINRVKLLWVRREQNLSGQIIEDRQNNKSNNV